MLTLAVSLLVGAFGAVAPAALVFPALAMGAHLWQTRRLGWFVAILAVLLLQAFRADRALSDRRAKRSSFLSQHAGLTRCEGRAEIRGSPALRGERYFAEAYFETSRCERGPPFAGGVTLGFDVPMARGDAASVTVDLGARTEFSNGLLLERALPASRRRVVASASVITTDGDFTSKPWSPGAIVDRARNAVRAQLRARFSREAEPLARALVLGESDLAPEVDASFKQSGLAHLLAVSGMHLIVVCGAFAWALRKMLSVVPKLVEAVPPARLVTALTAPIAVAYTDFTGASGSAVRAAAMVVVAALAHALGRKANVTRALVLAAGVAGIVDPLALFDISFSLSMAATASLLALAHVQRERGAPPATGSVETVKRVILASGVASLSCMPVLALLGAECSVVGPFLNLVAIPVGEAYALPLCLLATFTPNVPVMTSALVTASEGGLRLLAWLASLGARALVVELPIPHDFELGVLGGSAFLFVALLRGGRLEARARAKRWLIFAAVLLTGDEAFARLGRVFSRDLRVTFLDVGQGDASLLELPGGRTILIDAGGLVGSPVDVGRLVIAPALSTRRIKTVDVFVLSHPHPDHYGGIAEGLRTKTVREIWDSGLSTDGTNDAATSTAPATWIEQARRNGSVVRTARQLCQASPALGSSSDAAFSIDVLAPCPSFDPERHTNDNSLVLRVTKGSVRFLFAGDAERTEEDALLATGMPLDSEVLKVGHHGSRTSSSPAWIAAVSPRLAVISAGARNRFGHPRAETLDTLAAAGARTLRTDRDGAITVTTNGTALEFSAATLP